MTTLLFQVIRINGIVFGGFLFCLALLVFFFKFFIVPRLVRRLPNLVYPKELPQELIAELQGKFKALQRSDSKGETTIWLNSIISWCFVNLLDVTEAKPKLHQTISEGIVDLRRTPLGSLMVDSQLKDFEISGDSPLISNCCIVTGSSLITPPSSDPLTLRFDLSFDGSLQLLIHLKFIFGFTVNVLVDLSKVKVPILFVLQEKAFFLSLASHPESISHRIQIQFSKSNNGTLFYHASWLNRLVARYLVPFGLKFLQFPNFMGKWYRSGPDQPPYPWHPAVQTQPELLFNWSPKSD